MNLQSRNAESEQFQIAPMIDIVFVVLVFFIATYAVAEEEKRFEVRLPETTSATPMVYARQQIVVHLDQEGRIFLEQRHLEPSSLELRLKKLNRFVESEEGHLSVVIRADGRCQHKDVMTVMDVCARAGVHTIDFASVDQREELSP